MKKMVCDQCHSNAFTRAGSEWVCDFCRTRYQDSDIARQPQSADSEMQTPQMAMQAQPSYAAAAAPSPAIAPSVEQSPLSYTTAVVLSWVLGWAGVDRFYLGYIGQGVAKLFTVGGVYVWWLVDAINITAGNVRDSQGRMLRR